MSSEQQPVRVGASMEMPEDHGFALGLCGAFYMCGLLDDGEWRALVQRIPAG